MRHKGSRVGEKFQKGDRGEQRGRLRPWKLISGACTRFPKEDIRQKRRQKGEQITPGRGIAGILCHVSGKAGAYGTASGTALAQSVATAKLLELTRDFLRAFPCRPRAAVRLFSFPFFLLMPACLRFIGNGDGGQVCGNGRR